MEENKKMKLLELFSGIRSLSKALEKLGIDYECVDSVEIDKYAVKSQNAIYGTNFETQDITKWDKQLDVDLIMHGSPCQDFSLAGKQKGGDEGSGSRSSLLYETIRIVSNLKPKYVIWENVKNVLSQKHRHNFDNYLKEMEQLGYTNYYQVLNAKDYGIPQNRERVFTISIKNVKYLDFDDSYIKPLVDFIFPPKQELQLKLKDMLEDKVDEKYYLREDIFKKITNTEHKRFTNNNLQIEPIDYRYDDGLRNRVDKEVIPTLTCKVGTSGISGQPLLKIKEATKKGYKEAYDSDSVNLSYPESETRRGRVGEQVSQTLQCNDSMGVVEIPRIRKLTPKECWRLMGFDDKDFEKAALVNSNAQLYKQAGNSIVVNVLEAILINLFQLDNKIEGVINND